MTARVDSARRMSVEIARLDDSQVRDLVDSAETVGVGIGGTTKTVHVAGTPVFVKQLPITRSEETDPFATDNRAGLPFVCHYGIGSPSCGVGREVAAHQLTSEWVESGEVDFFPLLLGSRIVDLKPDVDLSEFDGDGPPQQWGTSWPQVERRLAEMKTARSSMVLFLEHVPETLGSALRRSLAEGSGESVFTDTVAQIIAATAWMEKQGFHHFDVHPGNILIHEGRLLFTDFGLSLHHRFDLTTEEASSLTTHPGFDRDTALMHLFHWVLYELGYTSGPRRLALLRAAATDPAAPELVPVRAGLGDTGVDLIAADASVVVRMTERFAVLMKDAFGGRYVAGSSRS
ncbi:hypothetical protein [Brevibacterium zhoupengii]|uniref:hypothetical protein n=1 Tax=Brevibacterium zhoupengii TaxID=2898795 RepID=UPI001F09ACCD|nr:hypothetical protein [Brevibacterium zhoupengii]